MPLDVLGMVPERFVWAIAAALVTVVVASLVMNRGNPWFLNAKAQDEPVLIAMGVFLMVGVGGIIGGAAAMLLILLGFVSRYTDAVQIDELV